MLIGLKGYHIDRTLDSPNVANTKNVKCRCTKEEWDNRIYQPTKTKDADKVKRSYIVLWNNPMNVPLVFNGKVVDDFFERHPEFDYKELFDVTKNSPIKNNTISPIADAFNLEVLKGRFKTQIVDARRQISDDDHIADNLGYTTPILSNSSRWLWRTPENEGKEGWAFIADIRKRNGRKGIEIRIPWGYIGFSKDLITYRDRVVYNGYNKTPTKEEELEVAMA